MDSIIDHIGERKHLKWCQTDGEYDTSRYQHMSHLVPLSDVTWVCSSFLGHQAAIFLSSASVKFHNDLCVQDFIYDETEKEWYGLDPLVGYLPDFTDWTTLCDYRWVVDVSVLIRPCDTPDEAVTCSRYNQC